MTKKARILKAEVTNPEKVVIEFQNGSNTYTINMSIIQATGLSYNLVNDETGDFMAEWEVSWEEMEIE